MLVVSFYFPILKHVLLVSGSMFCEGNEVLLMVFRRTLCKLESIDFCL